MLRLRGRAPTRGTTQNGFSGFQNLSGRVGSGRVWSTIFKLTRVGSVTLTRPDPTQIDPQGVIRPAKSPAFFSPIGSIDRLGAPTVYSSMMRYGFYV